jgi:RNA polymerase sigma-70 factor (ECF subfamily)
MKLMTGDRTERKTADTDRAPRQAFSSVPPEAIRTTASGEPPAGASGQERPVARHRHISSNDTFLSVIEGVCRQDPQRWGQFDEIYRPMLLAYLRKRGLKEPEANDVIQDIFVKLLGRIHTYDREKSSFRSWLFSVAHNTLVDRARRRASREKAREGWVLVVLAARVSDSVRMEHEWIKIHRERILAHALKTIRKRVSARVWYCFEQRLLKDRPGAEIAAELNIQPNAVYVNSCRVLKLVRSFCEDFDEDASQVFESSLRPRRADAT